MKVQDILDAISTSEIVQELVVLVLEEEPGKQALRAKASLKGGYVLVSLRLSEKASEAIPTMSKRMERWCEDGTTPHIGRNENIPPPLPPSQ